MSDHLPECIHTPEEFDPEQNISWGGKPCICDELRACERRVREEWYEVQSETWEQGYIHGLGAAREAITALPIAVYSYRPDDSLRDTGIWKSQVFAAIDALREKK